MCDVGVCCKHHNNPLEISGIHCYFFLSFFLSFFIIIFFLLFFFVCGVVVWGFFGGFGGFFEGWGGVFLPDVFLLVLFL